jgi:ribosome assembly protein YihI (activator of Der GTPase)
MTLATRAAQAVQAVQDEFQSRSGKPCSNRFAKALTKRVVEEELAALEALMPKLGVEDGDEPEGAEK